MSVLSSKLVTQMLPSPNETLVGRPPTEIGCPIALPVRSSIRLRVASCLLAIHASPPPNAIDTGWVPTVNHRTVLLLGSASGDGDHDRDDRGDHEHGAPDDQRQRRTALPAGRRGAGPRPAGLPRRRLLGRRRPARGTPLLLLRGRRALLRRRPLLRRRRPLRPRR